ncbi:hypothetical protein SSX86_002743 [Deinandra increscens subsp. villosa]|uniref:Nuclear pore complex protein NUP1 n=1 Tax=Deinandra increscens subsp. villosa TaxID=3103831 RepID=A0AAP0DP91_9ASTR
MATAGDGVTTYQSGGAGGKFRKRPVRRSAPATPYDRPPTAIRNNNNPSLLAKLVDPASRLLYAGADRLFGVFRKRLPSVPAQRLPGPTEEPKNGPQEAIPNSASKYSAGVVKPSTGDSGNLASISDATDVSDLEDMLKQKTFTRSEIERLTALLLSRTPESNFVEGDNEKLPSTSHHAPRPDVFTSGTLNKHVDGREIGNIDAAMSTPAGSLRAFEDDGASPADLAKAYMGTRSTKVSPLTTRPSSLVPRRDSVLLNNTTSFPKTPTTSLVPKSVDPIKTSENSLSTLRSRGRSALYNMPRTPYYRGPSTLSQKGVASPSAWEHEVSIGSSRMATKRRSSALDDIGSGGPMRRIRQKANLLSQQSSLSKYKNDLGSSQKLLLRNEPDPKGKQPVEETGETIKRNQSYGFVPTESSQMALKIFEQLERMSPKEKLSGSKLAGTTKKIDSPKLLSSSQDNQKLEGKNRVLFPDAHESSFQSKDTVKENGSRNIAGQSNVRSSVNGNFTVPVGGNAPIVTKAGSTTKRAFLMSAHEDSLGLDDDNHYNGHVSISSGENKKPTTSVLSNNDFSSGVHAEIIQKPTLPKVGGQAAISEADPVPGIPDFKNGALSPGGSIFNNQKMSFNFAASTSPNSNTPSVLSQQTSVVGSVSPQNKPTVFPMFGATTRNSAGPSEVNPKISPDATPLGATSSLINSTMNNDPVQVSPSKKLDNGDTQKPMNLFGNSGSSSSANLTAASASGIFSFGGSTNNSGIINGASASSPSVLASSGTSLNKMFSSSSSPVLSSATTAFLPSTTTTISASSSAFPTSMPASSFSFGSATASTTSASLAPTSPFASTSFATSSNGGSIFGLSSSSATSTTNGFQANTQAVPFKFGSGTSGTSSSTSASSLSSSSAPSFGLTSAIASSEIKSSGSNSGPTTNIFGSDFSSTPSFGLGSTFTSSETKSGGDATNIFSSSFSSTPSFGLSSTVASSETKSGSSTSNIFGSTPFSFGASSTSMPSASSSPFMFGSSNAGASTGSSMFSFSSKESSPAPVFGNSPAFGASPAFGTSPPNNNDHMSMEDSMVDDSNQTPSPSVPAFAQASSGPSGFMFGAAAPTTPSMAPFQFGGQTNQSQPPLQNTFPAPGSSPFNAGGSFSLGSGGDDKSSRRIVKVKRQNRRK